MELMLGIDLGTTHLKVAAFDAAGRQHSLEMSRTDTIFQGEGKAIYKPSVIWESAAALLKKTVSRLPSNYKISSIATASMGEAGLFLDHNFEPLTPIMAWFDVRGKEVMAEWYELIDAEKCRKITGLSSHNHICSLFKMLWEIKQNPVVLEKAAKWLCLPDFINFRLTGEFATDYSIASRTMLFDIEKKRWSEEILDLAGLPAGLLPKALPSGTIIGEVTKKAAAETGLPEGIPVCLGGHDHICGSFASNVICQGRVLDSMGTSESLVVVLEGLQQDGLADLAAYDVGCHVLPDLHYALGAIHAGGSSLEWFFRQVAKTKDSYESLVDEAGRAEWGARGLVFFPYLRGSGPPVIGAANRAVFLGAKDYHGRADFSRSIHEGLCFEIKAILDHLAESLGIRIDRIQAVGGGTRNKLWLEIKSAVLQKPVHVPQIQEATLLGAALLGGLGVGLYKDAAEAIEAVYRDGAIYEPQAAQVERYSEIYGLYKKLAPLVREVGGILG